MHESRGCVFLLVFSLAAGILSVSVAAPMTHGVTGDLPPLISHAIDALLAFFGMSLLLALGLVLDGAKNRRRGER